MLSSKHQIATYKQGQVYPKLLKPTSAHLAIATHLLDLIPGLMEESKDTVESALAEAVEYNPKVLAGLIQVLLQHASFQQSDPGAAASFRAKVFEQSALYWQEMASSETPVEGHRQLIIQSMPEMDCADKALELLFSDLASNQKLVCFEPLTPLELINRYNLGQAQTLLYKAAFLLLKVKGESNMAQLLQMLKFFGLLFQVVDQRQQQISLKVDGPTSVLEGSRGYGVELANFLPAIVSLQGDWEIEAPIQVEGKKGPYIWRCSHKDGLVSHYPSRYDWANERILALAKRFNQQYNPQMEMQVNKRIVELEHNQYLLPDFELSAGSKRLDIQWLRYLNPEKQAWLQQIKSQLPQNYRFMIKGKRQTYQSFLEQMSPYVCLFTSELTAPFLKKTLEAI